MTGISSLFTELNHIALTSERGFAGDVEMYDKTYKWELQALEILLYHEGVDKNIPRCKKLISQRETKVINLVKLKACLTYWCPLSALRSQNHEQMSNSKKCQIKQSSHASVILLAKKT